MRKHSRRFALLATLYLALSAPAYAQTQANATPILKVGGEVSNPLQLSAADLAKLPHTSTKAKDHSGKESVFEGVSLVEILKLAGMKFGEEFRGKQMALFLVVDAADGYRVVIALPELDPSFNDKLFLLADRRDSAPLTARDGPLQIIVPPEKRQGRWVRQVVSLTVRRAE
jgi:DMSO/TMAO reductase YedYZ molybdopterin-dependent catalytic subunit